MGKKTYTPLIEPGTKKERKERFVRRNFQLCAQAFEAMEEEAERELLHAVRLKKIFSEKSNSTLTMRSLYKTYEKVYDEEADKNIRPVKPLKVTPLHGR